MSIVDFDGPPAWSLDASETGESTSTTTHGHFVLSPVLLASRDQDRHLRSHGKIGVWFIPCGLFASKPIERVVSSLILTVKMSLRVHSKGQQVQSFRGHVKLEPHY